MPAWRTTLHPPVVQTAKHKVAVEKALAALAEQRPATRPMVLAPPADSYSIVLTTISTQGSFDSLINVSVRGAPTKPMALVVDTGNSFPILPDWTMIEAIPNWQESYTILSEGPGVTEPWGAPAKLVKGPLELAAADGSVFAMEDCVFYTCTGNVPGDDAPTANFGAGCLSQYMTAGDWPLRPAQTYNPTYPYAEFDFAPDHVVLSLTNELRVDTTSKLRISKTQPDGYQTFDIVPATWWMSLVPRGLSIGAVKTDWPNAARNPIAMIDTGGTCAYLSDPDGYVYNNLWPDKATNPDWTTKSVSCQSTFDAISLELGDAAGTFSYTLDTSGMPTPVQGLTLVMCKKNSFMMDQYGLNIGGVSALFVGILVDYQNTKVGLKLK